MKVNPLETLHCPPLSVVIRLVGEHIEREHDIVEHAHGVKQGSALKNHTHLSSQSDFLLFTEHAEITPVVEDFPLVRTEQSHDILHENRLSASALSDDEVDLPVFENGIDIFEYHSVIERLI